MKYKIIKRKIPTKSQTEFRPSSNFSILVKETLFIGN
jgi:hypothetical protein